MLPTTVPTWRAAVQKALGKNASLSNAKYLQLVRLAAHALARAAHSASAGDSAPGREACEQDSRLQASLLTRN